MRIAVVAPYIRHMSTKELIARIERLPMAQRIKLMEETLRGMRQKESKAALAKAAAALEKDYRENKALTAFTAIDFDNFYEAR